MDESPADQRLPHRCSQPLTVQAGLHVVAHATTQSHARYCKPVARMHRLSQVDTVILCKGVQRLLLEAAQTVHSHPAGKSPTCR